MGEIELVWNVYRCSTSDNRIVVWNIFDSHRFHERIGKIIKKNYEKDVFAKEVKSALIYCFMGKIEHEITVCHYPKTDNLNEGIRVDVCDEIMLNFDAFIDYLYAKIYGEKCERKVSSNPQVSG